MSSPNDHHPHTDNYQMEPARWATGRNVLMFAALVAVIACVAGYIQDPTRFFRSYIVAFAYTAVIGLGAFFFVMVQYLSGSAWSVTVRRIMENIMVTLPFGALLFIPVALGLKDIYSWTNADPGGARHGADSEVGLSFAELLHAAHLRFLRAVVAVDFLDLSPIHQAGHAISRSARCTSPRDGARRDCSWSSW